MNYLKKIIKAGLYKFGIIAMKRSSRVYLPEDESYRIAVAQCGRVDPTIIDGGAHRGEEIGHGGRQSGSLQLTTVFS